MAQIYAIVNKHDGKAYIGCSVRAMKRIRENIYRLNYGGHHNIDLQKAWRLQGKDAFGYVILEECDSSIMRQREFDYIANWIPNVYNVAGTDRRYGFLFKRAAPYTKNHFEIIDL